ncbi:hypothetical protein QAD02_023165 [Eretmocerus hayati]|uniref:Uncharacterized protein n=1 Tax=Eretmocerus hayati TaxID=131215 RepID=A0ACC2PX74_9HYME|nr:hypothetical protein QAD02_023165 [Eretmocerus hayati]
MDLRGSFILKHFLLLACFLLKLCTAHLFLTRTELSNTAIQLFDDICAHNAAKHEQNLNTFGSAFLQTLSNLSIEFEITRDLLPDNIAQQIHTAATNEEYKEFLESLSKIQNWFRELLNILENHGKNKISTLKEFSEATTSFSMESLKALIEKMYDEFTDLESRKIMIVGNESTKISNHTEKICPSVNSVQELIYQLYKVLTFSDLQGSLIIFHSYCMKEILFNDDYTHSKNLVVEDFNNRLSQITKQISKNSKNFSREIWKCDAAEPKNGVTYSKLGPVFQAYLVRETDVDKSKFLSFFTSCASMKKEKARKCKTSECGESKFKRCDGNLRDCSFVDRSLEFCPSPHDSDRRYEWMRTKSGAVFGHKTSDCNNTKIIQSHLTFDICICSCESEDPYEDRYFSLQDATSDIHENKVITGMRFSKRRHTFFIEIQQALMGPEGKIIGTPGWKAVEYVRSFQKINITDEMDIETDRWAKLHDNKMAYAVTYDHNTVYLDDLKNDNDKLVVTGLRFKKIHGSLGLEVQTTDFDYTTGRLNVGVNKWMSNSNATSKRTEFQLIKPDEPTRYFSKSFVRLSRNNQFVRFRMTDLGKDIGQNVVPFIDLQEVVTNPPSPLSGVGMILRGPENSGGFLAPKIIHFNHANYYH